MSKNGKNFDMQVSVVVCTGAADGFGVGNMIENGFEQLVLFQAGIALIEGIDSVLHVGDDMSALLNHKFALFDFTLDCSALGDESCALVGECLTALPEIFRGVYVRFDQFEGTIFAGLELFEATFYSAQTEVLFSNVGQEIFQWSGGQLKLLKPLHHRLQNKVSYFVHVGGYRWAAARGTDKLRWAERHITSLHPFAAGRADDQAGQWIVQAMDMRYGRALILRQQDSSFAELLRRDQCFMPPGIKLDFRIDRPGNGDFSVLQGLHARTVGSGDIACVMHVAD